MIVWIDTIASPLWAALQILPGGRDLPGRHNAASLHRYRSNILNTLTKFAQRRLLPRTLRRPGRNVAVNHASCGPVGILGVESGSPEGIRRRSPGTHL